MPVDMKNIIAETFYAMTQKKSLDKITVKALIEECKISRQTFYYHFQDIMDVIAWSVRQMIQKIVEKTLKTDSPQAALQIFISTAVQSYPLLQKLLDSHRRSEIEKLMVDAIRSYLQEILNAKADNVSLNCSDLAVTLSFYTYGIVGILVEYCAKPQLDQNKLADQMYLLLSGNMLHLTP